MLYSKSKMFKEAHKWTRQIIKEAETKLDYRVQFGLCLKALYNHSENLSDKLNNNDEFVSINIAKWFIKKNFTQNEIFAMTLMEKVIVRARTEKALKLQFVTEFGNITTWFPKSVINSVVAA